MFPKFGRLQRTKRPLCPHSCGLNCEIISRGTTKLHTTCHPSPRPCGLWSLEETVRWNIHVIELQGAIFELTFMESPACMNLQTQGPPSIIYIIYTFQVVNDGTSWNRKVQKMCRSCIKNAPTENYNCVNVMCRCCCTFYHVIVTGWFFHGGAMPFVSFHTFWCATCRTVAVYVHSFNFNVFLLNLTPVTRLCECF